MKLKKRMAALLLTLTVISSCFVGTTIFASPSPFPDTPDWCADAITDMTNQKILSGFEDGTFRPNQSMTRAQMAKVLHQIYVPDMDRAYMEGIPGNLELVQEADRVNPGCWANLYIATVNGMEMTDFGYAYSEWVKPISRIEMAHMASRYAYFHNLAYEGGADLTLDRNISVYVGDYNTFADHKWADDVLWMYDMGLVNGSDAQGTFHPFDSITRAQACAILYRIKSEENRVNVRISSTPKQEALPEIKGDYNPGSVYGPKLPQKELNEVKTAVQTFLTEYIEDDMTDYEKVYLAQYYLATTCTYAPDWGKNYANTAWGALIYHEAQCSGYTRAFKALCDAMDVGCYYVHADKNASNPSHQFNLVKVDGQWYVLDPQLNAETPAPGAAFLISEQKYRSLTGVTWDHTGLPETSSSNYTK